MLSGILWGGPKPVTMRSWIMAMWWPSMVKNLSYGICWYASVCSFGAVCTTTVKSTVCNCPGNPAALGQTWQILSGYKLWTFLPQSGVIVAGNVILWIHFSMAGCLCVCYAPINVSCIIDDIVLPWICNNSVNSIFMKSIIATRVTRGSVQILVARILNFSARRTSFTVSFLHESFRGTREKWS